MLKKKLLLPLAVVLAFGLTACTTDTDNEPDPDVEDPAIEEQVPEDEDTPADEEMPEDAEDGEEKTP